MNVKTLAKINQLGKVGKMVMNILLIVAILATLLICVATVYAATLPKDAVTVAVTNQAEFKINKNNFSAIWDMFTDSVSYANDKDPSAMLNDDDNSKILPPENEEINAELKFFQQSYSSATISSDGDKKIIKAKSSPMEYRSSDLTTLLVFATLFGASVAVAILLLQKLFKVLAACESPFCTDFVSKLRTFGYSLLPVVVFASIGETLAVRFLSAGKNNGIFIQWGLLIAFAVTMFLVAVFRYGVQLQKESDETL